MRHFIMASEQTRKRLINQSRILHFLRVNGQEQRAVVSRTLGIRNSSITNISRELIDHGALTSVTPGAYRSALSLNPSFWIAGVISIRADRITAGIVNIEGELVHFIEEKVASKEPSELLKNAAALLQTIQATSGLKLLGVGVSLRGRIDSEEGISHRSLHFPDWEDVHVTDRLERILGLGVTIVNDASCELLGNTWFQDWGKQLDTLLYLNVGEEIGSACMIEKKLVVGHHFAAGEIGSLLAGNEGRLCRCGELDCLDAYCSIPAIIEAMEKFDSSFRGKSLGQICSLPDPSKAIRSHLTKILTPLCETLAPLVAFTNPAGVVIASSDEQAIPYLKKIIEEGVHRRLCNPIQQSVAFFCGLPTNQGTLLGAGSAVFVKSFGSQNFAVKHRKVSSG